MSAIIRITKDRADDIIHLLETMQSEIDSLLSYSGATGGFGGNDKAIAEIRAVLAQEAVHVDEPVAWLYKNTNIGNELSFQKLDHFYRPYTPAGEHDYVKGIALYTSQPAPVAVVLPERIGLNGYGEYSPRDSGWNACLDKVKELNQ